MVPLAARLLPLLLLSPSGQRLSPERMEVLVREVGASVEKIRGLKFKTPVKAQFIDPKAARAQFKAKIEPWTEQEVRHTQRAYINLGLIPPASDLISGYLDLAEKDVLGYYDTKTKLLYILTHVPEDEVRPVLAHELTHALEDQHYDFAAVARQAEGDDDRSTAISAVIEGSATAMMIAYMTREVRDQQAVDKAEKSEAKRAERLKGAPSFVQQTVIMPYLLGFTFLLRGSPWMWDEGIPLADLDQAYQNPPRSTRQILHPEQYWWGAWRKWQDPPVLRDLSSALGPGWSRATQGHVGELGLAVLTGSRLDLSAPDALLPSRWTNDAAIGTQGDVYHHYVNGERTVTALFTRWETMRDAEQFDRALLSRGKYFLRYGVHILVLAGDIDPARGAQLASVAMQGVSYWSR